MTTQNKIDLYKQLSTDRKLGIENGTIPPWYTTAGLQLFKDRYLYKAANIKEQFERIANTAAKHLAPIGMEEEGRQQFFKMLWEGDLSPSTPVLSNMGTDRGMPVSCSGQHVPDSIDGFYSSYRETAILTKNSFGTSAYLGDIRPRGSKISGGGKASGVLPVFKHFVQDMRDVVQGTRRGAWAGYLEIDHGDFDELADFVFAEPDDANVGWIIKDSFIVKLEAKDPDSIRRYQKAMKLKMVTGRGYFCFIDKINAKRPQAYVNNNLTVKASNLCAEITLFADHAHTFSCVLSSLNVVNYDKWKDTKAAWWGTVFLDCVAQEFIEKAKNIPGLEAVVQFTQKGRALGLGQCGFHTYLQNNMIAFESFEAHMKSNEIASHIFEESLEASKWLAEKFGEPEWCKGLGVRNTHRVALPPTKSTALLMGGVSEGINPDPAMTYTQLTAGGETERINPKLLEIMKERNVFSKKTITDIKDKMGSVQHVDWLSEEEKLVFRTAFEINQTAILRMASSRGRWIDQWQSLNLFFAADEDPAWISEVHKQAFLDPNILGLYYIYTQAGVQAAKSSECLACQ